MPVTSAITRIRPRPKPASDRSTPATSDGVNSSSEARSGSVGAEMVELEGYAYSGGGCEIQRVDVSLDGGKTWDQATLLQGDINSERGSKSWCWKRWKYAGVVSGGETEDSVHQAQPPQTTFVVKATDDAYNTQPQTYESIFNLRGNLATAWYRVNYPLAPVVDRATR